MYSKTLEPKIDKMFSEIGANVSDIVTNSPTLKIASDQIITFVASETTTRSKTMLTDMYAAMSKKVLDSLTDVAKQNRFYEANLRQELFDKYSFVIPSGGIGYSEANRVYTSLAAGAGTAIIGGVLIFALSPTAPIVPIALVVAASVAAFFISYLKVTPNRNKKNFKEAIDKFLSEIKLDYIRWFDEVERYFDKRVVEIKQKV